MATVTQNPDHTYTVTPTPEELAILIRDPRDGQVARLPDVIAASVTRAIEAIEAGQRAALQHLYPSLTEGERGRVDAVLAEARDRITAGAEAAPGATK